MSTVNTRDVTPGDRIDMRDRAVIVASNDDSGLGVLWFTPEGLGPFYAVLPHCTLYRSFYDDERLGEHKSWWDIHPDVTGKTGEI